MTDAAMGSSQSYRGLRGWLDVVDKFGELERVSGTSGRSRWAPLSVIFRKTVSAFPDRALIKSGGRFEPSATVVTRR
jgi:hypothetical protein